MTPSSQVTPRTAEEQTSLDAAFDALQQSVNEHIEVFDAVVAERNALRATEARLREALERIVGHKSRNDSERRLFCKYAIQQARAALADGGKQS